LICVGDEYFADNCRKKCLFLSLLMFPVQLTINFSSPRDAEYISYQKYDVKQKKEKRICCLTSDFPCAISFSGKEEQ